MRIDPVHELPLSAPVFSEDGERLGKVKEVDGEFFKVDAALAPDFWLPCSAVLSYTAERVTLALTKDRIGDSKVERAERAD